MIRKVGGSAVFLLLVFVVFLANGSSLENEILTWDDQRYLHLSANLLPWRIDDLWWMLTSFQVSNWHPLTWFSYSVDNWIFGGTARGYHFSNLVFHSINSFLLFLLSRMLILKGLENSAIDGIQPKNADRLAFLSAFIAAMLFAVHPLHVESVAWIAERKDVLCATAFLSCLLLYIRSITQINSTSSRYWYGLAFVAALLALMAKPMAVSIPIVLVLLDIYLFRRLGLVAQHGRRSIWMVLDSRVVFEKIPFVLASLGVVVLTLLAQRHGERFKDSKPIPRGSGY